MLVQVLNFSTLPCKRLLVSHLLLQLWEEYLTTNNLHLDIACFLLLL